MNYYLTQFEQILKTSSNKYIKSLLFFIIQGILLVGFEIIALIYTDTSLWFALGTFVVLNQFKLFTNTNKYFHNKSFINNLRKDILILLNYLEFLYINKTFSKEVYINHLELLVKNIDYYFTKTYLKEGPDFSKVKDIISMPFLSNDKVKVFIDLYSFSKESLEDIVSDPLLDRKSDKIQMSLYILYKKFGYSISVLEGISISDLGNKIISDEDDFLEKLGLLENLSQQAQLLKKDLQKKYK